MPQRIPQAPQLNTVLSAVSQPVLVRPSQLPKPALHEPMAQAPPVHEGVALAGAQALPQAPQLDTLVLRFTSQPLVGAPSQLP